MINFHFFIRIVIFLRKKYVLIITSKKVLMVSIRSFAQIFTFFVISRYKNITDYKIKVHLPHH